MPIQPQNIYDEKKAEDFVDDPDEPVVDYWSSEIRIRRRKNIFWFIGFMLLIGGISYTAFVYTKAQKENETLFFGSRFSPGDHIISFRKTGPISGAMPDMEIVLNELRDIKPLELPKTGSAPLTPRWIKQVARYLILARQAEEAGHYEKALEEYSKVLVIFPNIEDVHVKRGMLYLKLEMYNEAATALKMALAQNNVDAGLVNNLGSCYMAMEQFGRAEKCYSRALKLDRQLDSARLNLATIYMKTGRSKQAMQKFETYIKDNPDDLKAAQAFAALLVDNAEWAHAINVLMQIQQQAPELAPVYFKLGEALSHTGSKPAAVEALNKGVLLVDPKKALGWLADERYDLLRNNDDFQKLINKLSSSN